MISVAIINNGFYNSHLKNYDYEKGISSSSIKIDVKELPEAVAQAVAKNYEGATIKEAYVAEKESGKVYKVILTTKDSQEVTVLMNEKGEEVKE